MVSELHHHGNHDAIQKRGTRNIQNRWLTAATLFSSKEDMTDMLVQTVRGGSPHEHPDPLPRLLISYSISLVSISSLR